MPKTSRLLVTLPIDLLRKFKKLAPLGTRSKIIKQAVSSFVEKQDEKMKWTKKKQDQGNTWDELLKLRKGAYTKEDAVLLQHNIWKHVTRH